MQNGSNPNPTTHPVRRWLDGAPPIAETLGEIRPRITSIDQMVVEAFYERLGLVIGATLFKTDPSEVQAPEQQQRNIDNAVAYAVELDPEAIGFHELIRSIWEVAVPGFVALQAEAFKDTGLISEASTERENI